MKIRPVGDELFDTEGRTDMTKLIVVFRKFYELANNGHRYRRRPKNCIQFGSYSHIPVDALDIANSFYSVGDFHFREHKKIVGWHKVK